MSTLRRSEIRAALVVIAGTLLAAPAKAEDTVAAPPTQRQDDDGLAPYRDRFRQGMEKYKAGAMAEAIRIWSAIYEEIGPQRGYRLSYNLARAYEANSETSRAAERYQSFLEEVAVRRHGTEALDPLVEHEATEAMRRLDDLNAKNGRIRVVSTGGTVAAQLDTADPRLGTFTTYVAPGLHVVIFGPGSSEEERTELTVKAGEIVEVNAPPPKEARTSLLLPAPTRRPVVRRTETVHPFPPAVLYVTVGGTVVSLIAPILTYAHAVHLLNEYYAKSATIANKTDIYPQYQVAKSTAYATLAIPLALTAVSGALVVYYFGGSKERELVVDAGAMQGGASMSICGSF